jgi:hypothetical protein
MRFFSNLVGEEDPSPPKRWRVKIHGVAPATKMAGGDSSEIKNESATRTADKY